MCKLSIVPLGRLALWVIFRDCGDVRGWCCCLPGREGGGGCGFGTGKEEGKRRRVEVGVLLGGRLVGGRWVAEA